MKQLALFLLLHLSIATHLLDNDTTSKTCVTTSISVPGYQISPRASHISSGSQGLELTLPGEVNDTSAFHLFPTSPPLRLPLVYDANTSCASHSYSNAPSARPSSFLWQNGTNMTRNVVSPTASYVPYSAGLSKWNREASTLLWQSLVSSVAGFLIAVL
jgi:hypothetical protein